MVNISLENISPAYGPTASPFWDRLVYHGSWHTDLAPLSSHVQLPNRVVRPDPEAPRTLFGRCAGAASATQQFELVLSS